MICFAHLDQLKSQLHQQGKYKYRSHCRWWSVSVVGGRSLFLVVVGSFIVVGRTSVVSVLSKADGRRPPLTWSLAPLKSQAVDKLRIIRRSFPCSAWNNGVDFSVYSFSGLCSGVPVVWLELNDCQLLLASLDVVLEPLECDFAH